MLSHVLIANRGEAALRVLRACRELGLRATVAVSQADADSLPARLADRAVVIGPPPAARSYLDGAAIVQAALGVGADAIHPGYGFLSESEDFARLVADAGLTFVGPPADVLARLGDKAGVRALAARANVPVTPGSGPLEDVDAARRAAERIGYPVLLKAAAGGGGRGIRRVDEASALAQLFPTAHAEARSAFGDGTLYLEKLVYPARHVEAQILGDGRGNVVVLGERDCSVQRRRQKLIEETPAPRLRDGTRSSLHAAARRLAEASGYVNAGTVEFLVDADENIYFMEINRRLQVEHPITEMVTGWDLAREQLLVAAGEANYRDGLVTPRGCSIECRINAEDPDHDFAPRVGVVTRYRPPGGPGVRVDSHLTAGYAVPPWYDSLLAKLIVWAPDRPTALARLARALDEFEIEGVPTTIPALQRIIAHPDFAAGGVATDWLERRSSL
ncbi:MAG: biotin carboxylase N-terminal domain-containing protein [Anaerolineae bacterium]